MITITSLHRYPVKGLRGIDVTTAKVMARGFEYDREWMVVDANNKFVTQRTASTMATIETSVSDTHLTLKHASVEPLHIPLEPIDGTAEDVVVWKDTCTAVNQGNNCSEWLSKVLQADKTGPVRLMRFAPDGSRQVEPNHLNGETAEVGFADGYPYLLANKSSLEALNEKLAEPVPMNRFRPNIVVNGLPSLDEHKLVAMNVKEQGVSFLLPKPCQRCKVTTVNQLTGEVAKSREPLITLVRGNTLAGLVGGYFGQNGVATEGLGESLSVGDVLDVSYA